MLTPAHTIAAVIVTYEPDLGALTENISRIATQVARVYIVDNSISANAQRDIRALQAANVEVDTVSANIGIAAALNRGIDSANARAPAFVVLLDQDSQPAENMVAVLMRDWQAAKDEGKRVAAIGPTQIDARTGTAAPFVRFGFPRNSKRWPDAGQTAVCDFLITSGSVLALDTFAQIGRFDEALFIDNVDMEWSHRATANGFLLLGSADAKMNHRLGDRLARRPGGHAAIHAPVRLYYMMRNRVNLYFRKNTPLIWIAQDIPRMLLKFLGFSLFVRPRRQNASAMLSGLADGLRGRLGGKPQFR